MARPAVLASLGALAVCACSVGLPDSLDGYGKKSDNRSDAIAIGPTPPTPGGDGGTVFPPAPGSDGGVDGGADGAPHVPSCLPTTPKTAFSPPSWAPPTSLHQKVCSATQAQTVTDCLLTTVVNPQNCDNFMYAQQNQPCIACALTTINAQHRGPILDDGQNYYTNPGGCVAALSGDSTANGCGAKLDALFACEWAYCTSCSSTPQTYSDCTAEADKSQCATYAEANTCSQPYAAQCIGTSPADEGLKLVTLWCGQ